MTELTTKMKELNPAMEIDVFTAHSSREEFEMGNARFEKFKGISIHRVPNLGKYHGTLFQRLLFSFTFFLKAFLFTFKKNRQYDAVLITTNPPFLGIIVLFFKFLFKKPYVIICYDVYPQILVKLGVLKANGIIYNFWKKLNVRIYNSAEKIISIGVDMTSIIVNEMHIKDLSKIELIHNWADKNTVAPVPENSNEFIKRYCLENKKILLYSGTMGTTHNIEPILLAADEMKYQNDIVFIFIGGGAKKKIVEEFIKSKSLNNILLLPFQPIEILSHTLSAASLSFVCLEDSFTGLSVPSKAYGIMAAGVPIIGLLRSDSEIANTIENYNCGVVWNNDSKLILSDLLLNVLSDETRLKVMRENALKAFVNNYDIEVSANKYVKLLDKVVTN